VQERWGKKGFWEGEKGSQVTALGSKQAMSVSYFCTLKICTKNVGQKKYQVLKHILISNQIILKAKFKKYTC